jgi:hypothetical protein
MLIKTTFKRRLNYKTLVETKTTKRFTILCKTSFKRRVLTFKRGIE